MKGFFLWIWASIVAVLNVAWLVLIFCAGFWLAMRIIRWGFMFVFRVNQSIYAHNQKANQGGSKS